MMLNELYHYGVIGMKWGVRRYQPYSYTGTRKKGKTGQEVGLARERQKKSLRRFQNEDGSLTDAGRKRLGEHMSVTAKDLSGYNDKKGLHISGKSEDIIAKGSTLQRIANKDETVDEKRKYMSITDNDNRAYREISDQLGYDPLETNTTYIDTYETKKNLKVASGKEISNYMLHKFGNKTVREVLESEYESKGYKDKDDAYSRRAKKILDEQGDTKVAYLWMPMDKNYHYYTKVSDNIKRYDGYNTDYTKSNNWAKVVYQTGKEVTRVLSQKLMKDEKLQKEVMDYYKAKGYDAIVDIEDQRYFEYPVIIINPKDSVKRTKQTKF